MSAHPPPLSGRAPTRAPWASTRSPPTNAPQRRLLGLVHEHRLRPRPGGVGHLRHGARQRGGLPLGRACRARSARPRMATTCASPTPAIPTGCSATTWAPTPSSGGTVSLAVASGDALGLQRIGSALECWDKPSGGQWTLKISHTDATYPVGYIGLRTMPPPGAGRLRRRPLNSPGTWPARRRPARAPAPAPPPAPPTTPPAWSAICC